MRRVVLLDFDGVVCTSTGYAAWKTALPDETDERRLLDEACVGRVDTLCEEVGAGVVVSSSWRLAYDDLRLRDMLASRGLAPGRVLGSIPRCIEGTREQEITRYLRLARLDPWDVVVLDDMPLRDLRPSVKRRHVRSDSTHGFDEACLAAAVGLFGVAGGRRLVRSE